MHAPLPRLDPQSELDAAFKAGQTDARLDTVEAHLRVINGSVAEGATALQNLLVEVTALRSSVTTFAKIVAIVAVPVLATALYAVFGGH